MCGRFTLAERLAELQSRFGIREINFDYKPRYNIAPTDEIVTIPVIKEEKKFKMFKWGIPLDEKLLINARDDKIDSYSHYKEGITKNRCLIPATGFYEWVKSGPKKIPYLIRSKMSRVIGFAGFYQNIEDIHYCTIITTSPNKHMEKIHDRMPVILMKEDESTWLSNDTSFSDAYNLIKPYPTEYTDSFVVSTKVNNVRNDTPDLVKPTTSLSNFF